MTTYTVNVMTDTTIARGPISTDIEFNTLSTPIIRHCKEKMTWSGKSGEMQFSDGFHQNTRGDPETDQMVQLSLTGANKTVTLSENVTIGSIDLFAGPWYAATTIVL